jgi:transcriptional adapter 2-alpha
VPRVKCAACPDFDLCLECFSVGAEISPHSSDHPYRIVDDLSFPIYHPEWGVSCCCCCF